MSKSQTTQDIAERLWASDAASALTNEGAREIERLRDQSAQRFAEIHRLRAALTATRNLIENDPDNLNMDSITDTIWISPIETLVDYIDAALEEKNA